MNLIGITGRAGAGKDSAADVLVKEFGFIRVALADPLKRICKEVFDFTDDQLWGSSDKRNEADPRYPRKGTYPEHPVCPGLYLTPRYALQTLGTEWARSCYENVWVEHTIRTAKALLVPDDTDSPFWGNQYSAKKGLFKGIIDFYRVPAAGVVIPDVRFPNELEAIKKAGGKIWRIIRPGAGLTGSARAHVSETALDDSDFDASEIWNTGTLEELEDTARGLARHQIVRGRQ
jgi:hypothetical protein